jgi:hypothetical protein
MWLVLCVVLCVTCSSIIVCGLLILSGGLCSPRSLTLRLCSVLKAEAMPSIPGGGEFGKFARGLALCC